MRRRYRIRHIITRLELGGAQQNTLFCTAHHDRTRFDVGLIAGRGGLLDEEALKIPDARVRLLPSLRRPIAPFWDTSTLLRLRACLKQERVDLVHTHSSKAGILGRWAAHLAGVPVVVHTAHGWSFNDTQPAWLRRSYVGLERLSASWTDRLITVSEHDREQGLALAIGRREKYEVIRSGIDTERFRGGANGADSFRRSLGFEPSHTVVGTLCCLKPQKAPQDFVRAAAAAYAQNDRLRFIIAGDGELRPRIEGLIEELGLGGVVRLLGWRRDVERVLQAMDVFLLTSLHEGLPRSVLQAMAAGVPVVATAVDGTPEVIEDGRTGLLVPPARPELAARQVLQIAKDEALRQRCISGARRRLNGGFDIHLMVRRLDEVYLSLLEERCFAST